MHQRRQHSSTTLTLLYPEGIPYDNILLVTTDTAPYMKAAMEGLAVLYLKMLHVKGLAHGMDRVCGMVRATFSHVNSLISSVKKVFRSPIYLPSNSSPVPYSTSNLGYQAVPNYWIASHLKETNKPYFFEYPTRPKALLKFYNKYK